MKNRKIVLRSIIAVIIASSVVVGCKKKEDTTAVTPADDALQQAVSVNDQNRVDNESNQSMDDANTAMLAVSTTKELESTSLCNVVIDSSQKATGLIVLNYNGNTCDNTRSRSGSISIQLPYINGAVRRWRTVGATVTLTYNNYKVTELSDNKSLTFNGTHTVTNVNGGVMSDLLTNPSNPIVHKIRANMVLTFDDGTTRTWGAARTRTFSIANNVISASVTGDTTFTNFSHNNYVAMWGVNRAGENFDISIPTPVVYNIYGSTCLYKPLSGVRIHEGIARVVTVTYGVDANGNPVTSGCPYGYKLNWTNLQGVAKQVVKSY